MGGKISAGFMTQQIRPVVIHRVKPSFIDNIFFPWQERCLNDKKSN